MLCIYKNRKCNRQLIKNIIEDNNKSLKTKPQVSYLHFKFPFILIDVEFEDNIQAGSTDFTLRRL